MVLYADIRQQNSPTLERTLKSSLSNRPETTLEIRTYLIESITALAPSASLYEQNKESDTLNVHRYPPSLQLLKTKMKNRIEHPESDDKNYGPVPTGDAITWTQII